MEYLNQDFKTGRAWIELDMSNLRHNVDYIKSLLPHDCLLMAVIKADAYQHGAVEIAKELNAHGIYAFCVATVLEAVRLREHDIEGEILILGYTHPRQFYLLEEYRLTQTVIDYNYAMALDKFGEALDVHVKIDTGMHRLGQRPDDIDGIIGVFECENLNVTGIYTQLCVCDTDRPDDKDFTEKQIDSFRDVLSRIEARGFHLPKKHVQSSYGIVNYRELNFDCARAGTSLLGMLNTIEDTKKYGAALRPVLSLKCRVSAVKNLLMGESIGYGLRFTATRDMRIAVLSIGYADGVPLALSCGVGNVLINGQKVPILGRICMDQMMVDITEAGVVRQGDTAVIIGKSGDNEITVCDIADQAGTATPDILSHLGSRLERSCFGGSNARHFTDHSYLCRAQSTRHLVCSHQGDRLSGEDESHPLLPGANFPS